jgi:hypothetical protein
VSEGAGLSYRIGSLGLCAPSIFTLPTEPTTSRPGTSSLRGEVVMYIPAGSLLNKGMASSMDMGTAMNSTRPCTFLISTSLLNLLRQGALYDDCIVVISL